MRRKPDFRNAVWALCVLLPFLIFGARASAQPKAEIRIPASFNEAEALAQGRALVAQLLAQQPEPATNSGTLRVRAENGQEKTQPIHIETFLGSGAWTIVYQTAAGDAGPGTKLTVSHFATGTNQYLLSQGASDSPRELAGDATMIPFAGSDFWVADLGLEFLQWPKQLLLRKEMRRSRECNVLVSYNPNPAPGSYLRVVSWIDIENNGILHADAYNAKNELLKQFDPTELKKVHGERQLEEMEMRNRKTGSYTWIKFDLER